MMHVVEDMNTVASTACSADANKHYESEEERIDRSSTTTSTTSMKSATAALPSVVYTSSPSSGTKSMSMSTSPRRAHHITTTTKSLSSKQNPSSSISVCSRLVLSLNGQKENDEESSASTAPTTASSTTIASLLFSLPLASDDDDPNHHGHRFHQSLPSCLVEGSTSFPQHSARWATAITPLEDDPDYDAFRNKRLEHPRTKQGDGDSGRRSSGGGGGGSSTPMGTTTGSSSSSLSLSSLTSSSSAAATLQEEETPPQEGLGFLIRNAATSNHRSSSTTIAVTDKSKLEELRAAKMERELQLRSLMAETTTARPTEGILRRTSMVPEDEKGSACCIPSHGTPSTSVTITTAPAPPAPQLLEPVVYNDMREELQKAYELIQLQKEQLKRQALQADLKNGNRVGFVLSCLPSRSATRGEEGQRSSDDDDDDDNDGDEEEDDRSAQVDVETFEVTTEQQQQTIALLRQERVNSELVLLRRWTENAVEYKRTIDHWKRETACWKQRFESSWDDHQGAVQSIQTEVDEWKQIAEEAENDLSSFKQGTEDTMLELVQAKERIHHLEDQEVNSPLCSRGGNSNDSSLRRIPMPSYSSSAAQESSDLQRREPLRRTAYVDIIAGSSKSNRSAKELPQRSSIAANHQSLFLEVAMSRHKQQDEGSNAATTSRNTKRLFPIISWGRSSSKHDEGNSTKGMDQ